MKAIEILVEAKKVNEAPANIVGQGLKRLGAGVLGAMGAKGMAGSLAGQADAGAKANELFGNFKRYLGQTGKDKNTATIQDLEDFLKKNKITTKLLKTTPINSWKDIDTFFTKLAHDSFKIGGIEVTPKGQKSSAQPASAGASQQSPQQAPAQSNTAAPATGTQGASQSQVPKLTLTQIKQAVSGLRTRDKQSLMAFLQQGTKQPAANKPAAPAQSATTEPTTAPAAATQPAPAANAPDENGRVEPTMDKDTAVKNAANTAASQGVDPATAVKPNTPALDKVRSGQSSSALNKVRANVAAKKKKSNPASASVAV